MSWVLRIENQPDGLRLRFPEPLSTLDMTPDVAQHLASLLAVEARHRMLGVVAVLNTERLVNKQNRVTADDDDHVLMCTCDSCLNGDDHA